MEMTENAPAATTTEATPSPAVEETHVDTTDWKAESRKWEKRAKENATAAEKLRAIEEANKTEAQKLTERAEAAEAKVREFEAAAERRSWRAEVSKETGIPVDILRGDTREEIEAHAKTLSRYFKQDSASVVGSDGMYPTTSAESGDWLRAMLTNR